MTPLCRDGLRGWRPLTPISATGSFTHPFGVEPKLCGVCRQGSTSIPYRGSYSSNKGQQFSVIPGCIVDNPCKICVSLVIDKMMIRHSGFVYRTDPFIVPITSPSMATSHLTRRFFIDLFPAENLLEGLGRVAMAIHGTGQLRHIAGRRPSSAL